MKITFLLLGLMFTTMLYAQKNEQLPYKQIPEYAKDFAAGNVVARFIDGLGYRFYWATEGLRAEDLEFKPAEDIRSTFESLKHIYDLTEVILNAVEKKPNIRPREEKKMTAEELRAGSLLNIQKASELFKDKEEISEFIILFDLNGNKSELPVWNLMNGSIADAIYHTGQIVSYRRMSGNPINPKVNVMMGKTGE
ncbi:DinB family protein [Chondrinema litorale]|uniref:DinB family protein n=1 Tax=Chondrinema litorale TaxID=2994555 RepID=UPI002542F95C|nr:DinB family protein [Chondrinema litorale]UZR97568.1 hypothetical protein OQ292_26455 [Chondrinema litorale]